MDTRSLPDLARDPVVVAEVEREVAGANEQFNSVEQVKRVAVLGEEWLPDSEEMTPTMKLKRRGSCPSTPTRSKPSTGRPVETARGQASSR